MFYNFEVKFILCILSLVCRGDMEGSNKLEASITQQQKTGITIYDSAIHLINSSRARFWPEPPTPILSHIQKFRHSCTTHLIPWPGSRSGRSSHDVNSVLTVYHSVIALSKDHSLIFFQVKNRTIEPETLLRHTVVRPSGDLTMRVMNARAFLLVFGLADQIKSLEFLCFHCSRTGEVLPLLGADAGMKVTTLEKRLDILTSTLNGIKVMVGLGSVPPMTLQDRHGGQVLRHFCSDPLRDVSRSELPQISAFCFQQFVTHLHLLSQRFNFTIQYLPAPKPMKGSEVAKIGLPAVYTNQNPLIVPFMNYYFVPKMDEHLVYCTPKGSVLYLKPLNILTDPADSWTWFLTLVVYAGTGLFLFTPRSKSVPPSEAPRAIMSGLSILIREVPSASNNSKLVFILALLAIVISSGYEGFIASYLIVVPSPHIFRSLTELLDAGYKLLVTTPVNSDDINISIASYVPAFRRAGNAGRLGQSFLPIHNYGGSYDELLYLIPGSKNYVGPAALTLGIKLQMVITKLNLQFVNTTCFQVRGEPIRIISNMRWIFMYAMANQFAGFVQLLDEIGVSEFFRSFVDLVYREILPRNFKILMLVRLGNIVKGLSLYGHIRTVFKLYGYGIGISIVYFSLEMLVTFHKEIRQWTRARLRFCGLRIIKLLRNLKSWRYRRT